MRFKIEWIIVVVIALIVTGCAPSANAEADCTKPKFDEYIYDLNGGAYFRSSTVKTWSVQGEKVVEGISFLYSDNGNLKLGTIQHVAEMTKSGCTYIGVPGANFYGILNGEKFSPTAGTVDQFYSYQLSPGASRTLQQFIDNGILEPLVLGTNHSIQIGDLIAIPREDTGLLTVYVITGFQDGQWVAQTDGALGIICRGRSGGPILMLSADGYYTNTVIGVVSAIDTDDQYRKTDNTGNTCSLKLYFTPIK